MKLWIENYVNARSFKPVGPTAAVRVFDPGAIKRPKGSKGEWNNCPQAPFPADLYKSVRAYTFDDVNYDIYPDDYRCELMSDPRAAPFTANMAEDLIRWFVRTKDDVDSILLHCHAGLSRSVALANALNEMFDLDADYIGHAAKFKNREDGYVGNDFVYRLTCEAAERLL